ncbi:hypothetical protein C1I89_22170 [Achromobacter pulmonis]|uniref:Uncharacterized protein n=1 Tax=Achromobacter pulmonis TaxID=1389932 RepID=A0A2N8KEL8_9BURK|nr:hypothetical protein C1I89_22170 [Achromobacter pulmonis]
MAFYDITGAPLAGLPASLIAMAGGPPEPPAPVPEAVSRFQGREAMWQTPHGDMSLFEAAEAVINDPATPAMYRRAWADLQGFRRDSEMLIAIAATLGLTAQDLDSLFILAAGIAA